MTWPIDKTVAQPSWSAKLKRSTSNLRKPTMKIRTADLVIQYLQSSCPLASVGH